MNFRNLRDWALRDIIGAEDLQGVTDRLNALWPLTVSGNLRVFRSPSGGTHLHVPDAPGSPPEILRVKVVEANVAAGPVVQLVKTVTEGTSDATGGVFPVVSLCKMATNNELYVFKPAGGLKGQPTYTPAGGEAEAIRWRDCRLPGLYDVTLTTVGGSSGADPADRTYDLKLTDYPAIISTAAQSPIVRFQARKMSDAAFGSAYINADGVVTLRLAYEGVSAGTCVVE